MTDSRFAGVRKLAYFMPLGKGECGGCGKPIVYNETIQLIEHVEPNPDCPRAWVKVVRTPEEEARIAAAPAERKAEDQTNRDRHAWMLANAPHPILGALVEAHGPAGDDVYPSCSACPAIHDDYGSEPADWPCPVWAFVSDRMEKP